MLISNHFLNRADEFERDEFERLWTDVSARIPQEKLEFLPNLSFIMLKPNAYLGGQIPAVLKALEQERVYVFAHRFRKLSELDLDRLYMFVKRRYSESWWVMRRAYGLAPCFPALVIGPQGDFPHLSLRIRDIVGPTTPIMGVGNGLRYAFRGTHRVFNTIHATDDPASVVREASVFFCLDEIVSALDAAADGEMFSRLDFNSRELVPDKAYALSFGLAKNQLKQQLLRETAIELKREPGCSLEWLYRHVSRLGDLLRIEQRILEWQLPLAVEYEQLCLVLDLQRKVLGTLAIEGRRLQTAAYRDDQVAYTSHQDEVVDVARVLEMVELMWPLSDDTSFMLVPDFEVYLARLVSRGVRFDVYTEVLLLAGWAAAFNELRDIGMGWPIEK